jgi:hypothetical protein
MQGRRLLIGIQSGRFSKHATLLNESNSGAAAVFDYRGISDSGIMEFRFCATLVTAMSKNNATTNRLIPADAASQNKLHQSRTGRTPRRRPGAGNTRPAPRRLQSAVSGAFRFGAIPIVLRIPRIVAFSISDWVGG